MSRSFCNPPPLIPRDRAHAAAVRERGGGTESEGAFGRRPGVFMPAPRPSGAGGRSNVSPVAYQRASGSDDECNVLQHSWLTTHYLAREREVVTRLVLSP